MVPFMKRIGLVQKCQSIVLIIVSMYVCMSKEECWEQLNSIYYSVSMPSYNSKIIKMD